MSLTLGRAHTLCSASSLSGCHRFNAGSVFLARRTQLAQRLFSGGQKLGRGWGGGGGVLLNPVASFLFVLIWKNRCGHLETPRGPLIESGDCSVAMEHLRHYPKLCSVSAWWRERPLNRTLFFYIQGISWTPLCPFIPSVSGLNRRHSAMLFLSTLYLMNQ